MYIGFLGPRGSFTHQVAHQAFPTAELVPYDTITEVMKAVEKGAVDYSVIPVENSIEGSVHETIDYLFHQADLQAVAEVVQPIFQQLMVASDSRDFQVIYSHPHALAQGKKYIEEHYPQVRLEATASTSYAACFVANHPDMPFAAIAPSAAAQEYGLTIIAQDIQEMSQNFTRFWVLGNEPFTLPLMKTARKCSLALTLPDNQPGALYKAMSVFAWRGIDLTKIESRPLKTALGEYFFILDVDNTQAELLGYALKELTSLGISYKILGDYFIYQAQ